MKTGNFRKPHIHGILRKISRPPQKDIFRDRQQAALLKEALRKKTAISCKKMAGKKVALRVVSERPEINGSISTGTQITTLRTGEITL
ncbi:hypothetical protein ACFQ3K_08365 [Brucella gallinifaecis]|uniref:Uncharacterized protein n=1 Tax=Brucella gallinifaecis TaxID=215590 RepID=A0A502BQZ3_9HYPH|nr:hypothetical protein [Brucella gallinifaecis]TPF75453.1 hypothetical protein FHY56_09335 [Brucella gallinifaecis]